MLLFKCFWSKLNLKTTASSSIFSSIWIIDKIYCVWSWPERLNKLGVNWKTACVNLFWQCVNFFQTQISQLFKRGKSCSLGAHLIFSCFPRPSCSLYKFCKLTFWLSSVYTGLHWFTFFARRCDFPFKILRVNALHKCDWNGHSRIIDGHFTGLK